MTEAIVETKPNGQVSGLVITELSVRHGKALTIPSLSLGPLQRSELVVVIGPNGAGKSTFVRAIAGLGLARGQIVHQCMRKRLGPRRGDACGLSYP